MKSRVVSSKEDVITHLYEIRDQLLNLGVVRVGIFGSFVRGEQQSDSDVDLLIEFIPGTKTFSNFMNAAYLLEETMGRRVEVVTLEGLSPYIGPHILEELEYVSIAA